MYMRIVQKKRIVGEKLRMYFQRKKNCVPSGGYNWKTESPSPDSNIDIILIKLSLIQSDIIIIGMPIRELLFKGIKRESVYL